MRITRWSLVLVAIAGCSGPSEAADASTPDDATAPVIDTGLVGRDVGPASDRAIGEWTDAPGSCPAGATRVDITTVQEMEDASRGDAHTEGTCFFVHDGVYTQRGSTLPLYFMRGGTAAAPVTWVGESRTGVVIHGRATFESGGIVLTNMTFDLTGYAQTGSFNTITVLADDVTISHVTLTGDCMTGLRGGHIEVDGGAGPVLIEACLIERFGQCNGDGHLDHGIYLAAGHDITIRNDVIRQNSSRGIQLNTEGGSFGTLHTVTIEQNRIYENGHRDFEDGIVMNGSGTGDITDVMVRYNLFYRNFYSGIRFTGDVITGVSVEHNTFVADGMASEATGRSEINLDNGTPMAMVHGNVFVPQRSVVNTCDPGLLVSGNVVMGDASGACVRGTVSADPMFVAPASDDYHTGNPAVVAYGAYAP
jgi:hypothetical protein